MADIQKFNEAALEEGMPTSRALRRRARSYLTQAGYLVNGKSGLTKKEQAKSLKHAGRFAAAAAEDLVAAGEAHAEDN